VSVFNWSICGNIVASPCSSISTAADSWDLIQARTAFEVAGGHQELPLIHASQGRLTSNFQGARDERMKDPSRERRFQALLDADSDAQGPAWPESPGLGLAWAGSGLEFLKPEPEPTSRAWPGLAWA
jgi:hypothetical protein